jgi:2-keto-4-pentenoate hydratase
LWQRAEHGEIPSMIETTTLTPQDLDRLALALQFARDRREPIAPPTETLPDLSVTDAYAIAQRNVAARVAAGAAIVGHKIGLTSPAVQEQLGVDQPDYGTLLDAMRIADGASVEAGAFIAPRIELELAFELGEPLSSAGVTAEDVRRATKQVIPALELCDSRVRDWRIRLADTVADAASSAAFVLGTTGVAPADLDTADVAGELYRGDELLETGHSSAVLGDPCLSVAWLANALGALGENLQAGQIILSGACTRMVDVHPGDHFRGVLAGIGDVSVTFGEATR